VEATTITFSGITFDPGVTSDTTVRTCLNELEAAGFTMTREEGYTGYLIDIPGVVIPTEAELAVMRQPIEVLQEDHKKFYRHQQFVLSTKNFDENGDLIVESSDEELTPLEERFPEETAEWQERVELAEKYRRRPSRRATR